MRLAVLSIVKIPSLRIFDAFPNSSGGFIS